jgi:predicted XRE-type DNA-binding protein
MRVLTNKFNSVWDALENTESLAANMKAKTKIMIALHDVVEGMGLTQAQASKNLNITQPRLNDLLKGRINRFSLDALFNLAYCAGLEINVTLKKIS